jgi:hypothetical protein
MNTKFKKTDKQRITKTLSAIAIASILLGSITLANIQPAYAVTMIETFDDKTAFTTSTGATSVGAMPNVGLVAGGASAFQVVGSANFTISAPSTALFVGMGGGSDWTTRTAGHDIAISGTENLNVNFTAPVFSAGFEFVEPEFDPNVNAPFAESTFNVTLKNGATTVDSFLFSAPNDVLYFVGVWSNDPFDRMEIVETIGDSENEFFGEFFTGDTPRPEGCSPGFWKTHTDDTKYPNAWPSTSYAPTDDFETVFGIDLPASFGEPTLDDALNAKGGNKINQLLRFATATLLNADHPEIVPEEPYDTAAEIIAIVQVVDAASYSKSSIQNAIGQIAPQTDWGCSITGQET